MRHFTVLLAVVAFASFASFGASAFGATNLLSNGNLDLTHAEEIVPRLRAALQARTALEWEALFGERVPCAAVRTIEDMFAHPQVLAEGIVAEYDHPTVGCYRGLSKPLVFGAGSGPAPVTAPLLGQHTAEVLARHGYTEEEIGHLRGLGAVA